MKEKVLYVGIDVAKLKFDVAFTFDGDDCIFFQTIENNQIGFKKLLKIVKKFEKKYKTQSVHYCMEATGIYHCELCEYLQTYSAHIVSVINPVQSKSFAKSHLLRTKNDKVDAMMLSQYAYSNKPKATSKLPEIIKKLRTYVRYQNALVKSLNREFGKLEGCIDEDEKNFIQEHIVFLKQQQKEIIERIKNLIKNDNFLNNQIKLLKTVDGIGDKSAWIILSELKFDSIETLSPKAQVCNAGLSPRHFDSGSSVKSRAHISKMGNKLIRKVLYMPALSRIKRENYFTAFYHRLIKNGKSHRQAQVAVMRKMLYVACGVLKNQTPFDLNWSKKVQENYLKNLKVA